MVNHNDLFYVDKCVRMFVKGILKKCTSRQRIPNFPRASQFCCGTDGQEPTANFGREFRKHVTPGANLKIEFQNSESRNKSESRDVYFASLDDEGLPTGQNTCNEKRTTK